MKLADLANVPYQAVDRRQGKGPEKGELIWGPSPHIQVTIAF